MWTVKLKIKHDCTIGNRCEKFSCTSNSMPLTSWSDGNYEYVLGQHILMGDSKNISAFIKSLKKDSRTVRVFKEGNIIYLLERHQRVKIPARLYNQQFFFVKPVYVDTKGYEYWELASFDKEVLMEYIKILKMQKDFSVVVEKISKSKIKSIWYQKTAPVMTSKQERAFQLAFEEGYYKFPRKINLEKLAAIMKVSKSTFQEHLRKAESKVIAYVKSN